MQINEELNLTESRAKFITYKNYLYFLSKTITDNYKTLIDLYNQYISINKVISFNSKKYNKDKIRKILFNAWNSELVCNCYSILPEAIMSLVNHWKPINLYYSLYFLTESIYTWIEGKESSSHQNVINYINNIIRTKGIFLYPWNLLYNDDNNSEYKNFPTGYIPQKQSSLTSSRGNQLDSIAMWLRTTHQEKRELKWKHMSRNDKSRFRKSGKVKRNLSVGYTSIFDCLFRFRKWANYDEAEAFLFGPNSEDESKEFSASIFIIHNYSMSMLEMICKDVFGKDIFIDSMSKYISEISKKLEVKYLEERMQLLSK